MARSVVVTGAAGGAGSAAVEAFATDGAKVAAIVLGARLKATTLAAGSVTEFVCDVSDAEAVNSTFGRISQQLGPIDALIHTAAIESHVAAADVSPQQLTTILSTNVGGTVFTNQAAYRLMKDTGGGSIVNFHSLAAIRGFSMLAHYAASKGAVGAWTRVAAIEWGADNVRVNAIAPVMRTRMAEAHEASLSAEELAAHKESVRQLIHLKNGELGDPAADIAPLLRFLAGDGSRYITGQTIAVDGGMVKLGS